MIAPRQLHSQEERSIFDLIERVLEATAYVKDKQFEQLEERCRNLETRVSELAAQLADLRKEPPL